jgi:hypothetical protein
MRSIRRIRGAYRIQWRKIDLLELEGLAGSNEGKFTGNVGLLGGGRGKQLVSIKKINDVK